MSDIPQSNVASLRIQGLRGHDKRATITTALVQRVTALEDALTGLVLELEAAGALPPLPDKEADDLVSQRHRDDDPPFSGSPPLRDVREGRETA